MADHLVRRLEVGTSPKIQSDKIIGKIWYAASDGSMKKIIDWRAFLIYILVTTSISFGASIFLNVPFWQIFLITSGALFLNGILATIEEDQPGGFNNPEIDSEKKK